MRMLPNLLILLATSLPMTGCTTCQLQIWANSDSNDPKLFTQRNPHSVHVGETVQFRVLVEPDVASYVVADLNGQLFLMEKAGTGEYALAKRFDESWVDQKIQLEARAYRQIGNADYIFEADQVRENPLAADSPDELLGSTKMHIKCYQSNIILKIRPPNDGEPDWSTATLRIFGPQNKKTDVKIGIANEDGFVVLGKDVWSNYIIFYEPKIEQIHRTGKTRAALIYRDPDTQVKHTQEITFDTP